jgi:hypothetical protein
MFTSPFYRAEDKGTGMVGNNLYLSFVLRDFSKSPEYKYILYLPAFFTIIFRELGIRN